LVEFAHCFFVAFFELPVSSAGARKAAQCSHCSKHVLGAQTVGTPSPVVGELETFTNR